MAKLSAIMSFTAGLNMARLKKSIKEDTAYTVDDLDNDLLGIDRKVPGKEAAGEYTVKSGDTVICLTRSQATIITPATTGKYINVNFVKCIFDEKIMNAWYFCYLFNESPAVRHQMAKVQQGSITGVSKLTLNHIGNLEIGILPDIETQTKIGCIYKQALHTEYLMKIQAEQVKQFTLSFINHIHKQQGE
ncbi:MAG: hypothetical protein PHU79_04980 [Oscillospiraceae bacterium]|nr:hypothetical protein [Oscillospiraceae bacterium]